MVPEANASIQNRSSYQPMISSLLQGGDGEFGTDL